VIGPLSSATLRAVPAAQHGIASAAVVVARMTGMLIGVAALTAWGLYRFNQILAGLSASIPPNASLLERAARIAAQYQQAFALMYGDMFKVTAAVCAVGAVLGFLLFGTREHTEEPEVLEEEPAVTPTT